jgi:rhamnosyltransferase
MTPRAVSSAIAPPEVAAIQDSIPRVAVLLATYNGSGYLADQVDSILEQASCTVDIWVSDDQSTDGTWEWLLKRRELDPRISLLPRTGRFGNAARNFYRLLSDVDTSAYDYVALSDQDDIWFTDKLTRSIRQLRERKAAAVSSNVIALWPDGRQVLIRKSQRQRRLDFLFESAGPGCTYVITAECAAGFRQFLMRNRNAVEAINFHDWMLYAWVRSQGLQWHIDPTATMYYRQHDKNEYGANSGWSAFQKRITQVRSGWYREQILQIAHLVRGGSAYTAECAETVSLLENGSVVSRIALAMKASQLRRKISNRVWLVLACLLGGI